MCCGGFRADRWLQYETVNFSNSPEQKPKWIWKSLKNWEKTEEAKPESVILLTLSEILLQQEESLFQWRDQGPRGLWKEFLNWVVYWSRNWGTDFTHLSGLSPLRSLSKVEVCLPDSGTTHFSCIRITWVVSEKKGVGREVINQELSPSNIPRFKWN